MRTFILIFLLFAGCSNDRQLIQCDNLCRTLDGTCNSFEYGYCYDFCIGLDTQGEVDNFQSCSECFMAIECNDRLYGSVCYPACER